MASGCVQQTLKSGETVFFFTDYSTGEQEKLQDNIEHGQQSITHTATGPSMQTIGTQTDDDVTAVAIVTTSRDSGTSTAATKKYNSTGTETDLNAVADRKTLESLLRWALTICTTENSDPVSIEGFSSLPRSDRDSVQLESPERKCSNQGDQSEIPHEEGRVLTDQDVSSSASVNFDGSHFARNIHSNIVSMVSQSNPGQARDDLVKAQVAIPGEANITQIASEHMRETALQDHEMESTGQPMVDVNSVQYNASYVSAQNQRNMALIVKESGVNEKSECAIEQDLHVSDEMFGQPRVQIKEGIAALRRKLLGTQSGHYRVETMHPPISMATPVAATTMQNATPIVTTLTSLHGGGAIIGIESYEGSEFQSTGSTCRPGVIFNSSINQTTQIPTTSIALQGPKLHSQLSLSSKHYQGTSDHHQRTMTTEQNLGALKHHQSTLELNPGTLKNYPGTKEQQLDIIGHHPGKSQNYPGTINNHLSTTEHHLDASKYHQGKLNNYQGASEDYQGTMGNQSGKPEHCPGKSDNYQGTIDNQPGTIENSFGTPHQVLQTVPHHAEHTKLDPLKGTSHKQFPNQQLSVRTFQCNICDRTFSRKFNLQRHAIRHSAEGNIFDCKFCHMQFSRKDYLKRHTETHTPVENPYGCPECHARFKNLFGLQKHLSVHTAS